MDRTTAEVMTLDLLRFLIDFVLRIGAHLAEMIRAYGAWTYGILFAIIFCETGLVVTPLLPGDSLPFAAGAFAGAGALDPWLLFALLAGAGILGHSSNYWIGAFVGPKVFTEGHRLLNPEHLRRTHEFYERHGGKAVILSRFVPIVRTFAPFVAGIGAMTYPKFLFYNVVGAVAWVGMFVFLGCFFGGLPAVEENFTLVIYAILVVSVMPMAWEYLRARARAT